MSALAWRVATVVAVQAETATASTLVLDVAGWPGHDAGQHLDVRLTAPDGYSASRSYSISSAWTGESASTGSTVEITVERFEDGEVSPYLVDELHVGDALEVRGPLGRWFVWRPAQPEPIQLVAGGSGVVPLMSMLRMRALTDNAAPFRLLYSVRSPDLVIYRDELTRLAAATDVAISYVFTRTAEGARPAGRVAVADVAASTLPAAVQPTCYVCGPTAFVETVANLLLALGHDSSRIRTERFGGATT